MGKFLVILLWGIGATQAATLTQVPPPPTPSGIPTTAGYISECVGISETGVAACNFTYSWKVYVNRFCCRRQRDVAAVYSDGVTKALIAPPGEMYTRVGGITPGGKSWGVSSPDLSTFNVVVWDTNGVPTKYGAGTPVDADDLGRIAMGASIYDPATAAWNVVPGALSMLALSNNGDAVGIFSWPDNGGIEHVAAYRVSDFLSHGAEDVCVYPCIDVGAMSPEKMRMNGSGVVVGYQAFFSLPAISFRAIPGAFAEKFSGMALTGVNDLGDAVGGVSILRPNGTTDMLPQSGDGFTVFGGLSINSSGTVVGAGMATVGVSSLRRGGIVTP